MLFFVCLTVNNFIDRLSNLSWVKAGFNINETQVEASYYINKIKLFLHKYCLCPLVLMLLFLLFA